ncbi:deubiquitinase [Chlamydia trachomatis]|uniref:deubiquitinase/deneddylase Dub2 n=1 Tax=Chlamydia trachomatis TaxID=813 RepID=UPI0039BEB607
MEPIHNPPPQTCSYSRPSTTYTSFKDASCGTKVTRIIIALFLIVISCGLILCAYTFRDLLDADYLAQEGPQQATKLLQQLDKVLTGPPLPIWDNEHLFQFSCLMQNKHRRVLPIDICNPLTKFNFLEYICNCLMTKQSVNVNETDMCELFCPPTCTPENYRRLLCTSSVFPFVMWHDPSADTQEAMLTKMDQTMSSGRVGNSHWVLVIVDIEYRCVTFFDSLCDYVASPQQMREQLEGLAVSLGAIYPKEGGADSDQEELLSPFQVRIGSTVKVQSPGEFTCGAWCCQFLAWYLENPDFDLEEKVPTNPSERRALLADFISTTEQAMSRYSSLSWPTTD